MTSYQDLLDFWFADLATPAKAMKLWFTADPELDATLQTRFGGLLAEAEAGGLRDWETNPDGLLALVVLLDQFSRNCHRGSGKAFANDERARILAQRARAAGWDQAMLPLERLFLYLPFEHSEDLADQELSVSLFAELQKVAPPEQNAIFAGIYDYALRHRDVIARFGRFPHRNERLGRTSTPVELSFLAEPGSSFG